MMQHVFGEGMIVCLLSVFKKSRKVQMYVGAKKKVICRLCVSADDIPLAILYSCKIAQSIQ